MWFLTKIHIILTAKGLHKCIDCRWSVAFPPIPKPPFHGFPEPKVF